MKDPGECFDLSNWRTVCGQWSDVLQDAYTKGPGSPEAKRLALLSDLIRDRLRVRCVHVDAAAMSALETIRETLSHLPSDGSNVIGSEVTTPIAKAYVAVRALWEHENDRLGDGAKLDNGKHGNEVPLWLTASEVAKLVGRSTAHISRLARKGRINGRQLGGVGTEWQVDARGAAEHFGSEASALWHKIKAERSN